MHKSFWSTLTTLALSLVLAGSPAAANPAFRQLFETPLARFLMSNTRAGANLINRITGGATDHVTDSTYASFRQRLEWQQTRPIRNELARELESLRVKFKEHRVRANRPEEMTDGEILTSEDISLLESEAQISFNALRIEDALTESMIFYDVQRTPFGVTRPIPRQVSTARGDAPGPSVPTPGTNATSPAAAQLQSMVAMSAPPLPMSTTTPELDLHAAELTWSQGIRERVRAYRGFIDTFRLSEGQFRSLARLGGRDFTVGDLQRLRKMNLLLDGLNEYARMRLIVRSFAMERPYLYTQLNARTVDATSKYLEGAMSIEDYVGARRVVSQDLGMNKIVAEAEDRMLRAIDRSKVLGGGRIAGRDQRSLIDLAEDNIRAYNANIQELDGPAGKIAKTTREISETSDSARGNELRHQLIHENADLALWKQRRDLAARELRESYLEFIDHYDNLELFLNLRQGRINTEEVQAFDMPDSFVVGAEDLGEWEPIYERAIYNSTNALVLNESRLFFRTRVGSTRKFITFMNTQTGRYFGKNVFTRKFIGQRFTETPLGREFLKFNRSIAMEISLRVAKTLGVVAPAACAADFATDGKVDVCDWAYGQADKLWERIWGMGENTSNEEGAKIPGKDSEKEPTKEPSSRKPTPEQKPRSEAPEPSSRDWRGHRAGPPPPH